MGSGASACEEPGGELRLPASGLKFSVAQLRTLNALVDTLQEEDETGRMSEEMESEVEGLVQRIVDGAGQLDQRFRCCHVIALHRDKLMRSRSLEYLVTLDALPVLNSGRQDCSLQEGPVGYGKIRLTGREAEKWEEFLTPAGYLCRDKLLERWVSLVARCASARGGGGARVLGAWAAVRAKPYEYCYLERTTSPQSSTSHRLAIVEGATWVSVRVGAGRAEAKLTLGARAHGLSPHAQPARVPLTHPMALLHYTAAEGGYYVVSARGRWQLWQPALEAAIDTHCDRNSSVARLAAAVNAIVDRMRDRRYQGRLRGVSRQLCACAVRARLHACGALRTARARCCAAAHASHHLLLVLDHVYAICSRGGVAGYVFPVDRESLARRGLKDVDWAEDAACLLSCLNYLHRVNGEDIPPSPSECLETALFSRWEALNKESKSAASTGQYSRRQLGYLWRLSQGLIHCKNLVHTDHHSNFRANLIQATSPVKDPIEDLIHILAIMLDQARDLYMNNFRSGNVGEFDRELSAYRSKKWNKLKEYYDASSACLIDAVRRDLDLRRDDLSDPITVMRNTLNWLHKGAKEDKKYLGPVLKPYLDNLFTSSLENCWFLAEFYERKCEKEFEGLKEYCLGVHEGKVEPCAGLLEAAKTLAWAKTLVDFVEKFRYIDFRLVFPTGAGMAISFPLKLSRSEHSSARTLTFDRRGKAEAKLRLARRCVLGAFAVALAGDRIQNPKTIPRHESSEEILKSIKQGNFWRNSTKPDIIPSPQETPDTFPKARRRSRRSRPVTTYGYPEISITQDKDAKTLRRKYHTLKSLVYTEPVESVKEMRERPRSAGSTLRNKPLSRPSLIETLDFINGVKDALCVEESGASDTEEVTWGAAQERLCGLSALAGAARGGTARLALGDLPAALLARPALSTLQELCAYLGEASEGALFSLHRLARASRSKSSERVSSTWKIPEEDGASPQRYRARPVDDTSSDEAPQPPPLPRRSSKERQIKQYKDYTPPKRLQELEINLRQLETANSKLPPSLSYPQPPFNQSQTLLNDSYTGIINPLYDVKIPRDKFVVKRSKSLGRAFSARNIGLEIKRYNLTLGRRNGRRSNDVITAINGTTGETGLETKEHYLQRSSTNIVGDSYKIRTATVD